MLAMPMLASGQQTPSTPGMSGGPGSGGSGMGTRMEQQEQRGQQGMNQEQIKHAQEQLKEAGFDPGPIDGQFGPQTQAALREFQKSHGLPQTGQFDQATKQQLMAQSGRESPSGSMPGGRLSDEPRPGSSTPGSSMPGGRTSDEPRPGSSTPGGSGSGR